MSVCGGNSYVIEGSKGKEIYDIIMSSIDKCVEFNDKYVENIKRTFDNDYIPVEYIEYEIGTYKEKKYSISKIHNYDGEIEYSIRISCNGEYFEESSFTMADIEWKDNYLRINDSTYNSIGVFYTFFKDSKLCKDSGFYYYGWTEQRMGGWTNDKDGKYFSRYCAIMGICYKELADFEGSEEELKVKQKEIEEQIFPDNFSELSFEEQLAICQKHSDNLWYQATKLIEFD